MKFSTRRRELPGDLESPSPTVTDAASETLRRVGCTLPRHIIQHYATLLYLPIALNNRQKITAFPLAYSYNKGSEYPREFNGIN